MPYLCDSIKDLRTHVEYTLDHPIHTFSDLKFLAWNISEKTGETVYPEIFKPIWNIDDDGSIPILISTLRIMAEYVNIPEWTTYKKLNNSIDELAQNNIFLYTSLSPQQLEVGNHVEIGWGKISFCYLDYYGDDRFFIRRSIHTKLEAGDTFRCKLFEVGKPAQLTHLDTKTDKDLILILGQKEGLKNIQVITQKIDKFL
jgi:hypothetical protein